MFLSSVRSCKGCVPAEFLHLGSRSSPWRRPASEEVQWHDEQIKVIRQVLQEM
jgi:hypothetical protein